ncbi:MAG: hypothetical protein ABIH68_00840 [bacterium]
MSQIKLLFALALLVGITLLTVFAPPNISELPPMMLVVVSLFLGAAVSAVVGIAENVGLRKNIKKQKKETELLQEKIQKLQLQIREFEEQKEEKQTKENPPDYI